MAAFLGSREVCLLPDPSLAERVMLVSTYEEFMVLLTIGLLIVAVLNVKNK